MPFTAGQEVRASDLIDAVIRTGYTSASTTRTSSTVLIDAVGLALALEANTVYAWDCYLAYNAAEAADLKLAWSGPAGAVGHWGAYGGATSGAGGVGDLSALRVNGYGSGNTIPLGGNNTPSAPGPMVARPMGYIEVGATPGNLQCQFAQQSSNATGTIIQAGCWLRAWKLA